MLRQNRIAYFLIGVCVCIVSVRSVAQTASPPEEIFENVWQTLDFRYGNFVPKGVDWDHIYRIYRPGVSSETTDDELQSILSSMLDHLNDRHVALIAEDWSFRSGNPMHEKRDDFSRDLVSRKYLGGDFVKEEIAKNHSLIYGKLTDKIGYLHFTAFTNRRIAEMVDQLLNLCADCDGIVVDVRNNGGGQDLLGREIAGRFADAKRPYLKTRHSDSRGTLRKAKTWYIEPQGERQFTGPVVVITNEGSASAAEVFTQGMRTLPHVTHIGERTAGVFADFRADEGKIDIDVNPIRRSGGQRDAKKLGFEAK